MDNEFKPVLPSAQSALNFINKKPGAEFEVVEHLAGRSLIILLGFQFSYLLNMKPPKNQIFFSILGATAIEIFVIQYIKNQVKQNGN